jgi:hypothetical protein
MSPAYVTKHSGRAVHRDCRRGAGDPTAFYPDDTDRSLPWVRRGRRSHPEPLSAPRQRSTMARMTCSRGTRGPPLLLSQSVLRLPDFLRTVGSLGAGLRPAIHGSDRWDGGLGPAPQRGSLGLIRLERRCQGQRHHDSSGLTDGPGSGIGGPRVVSIDDWALRKGHTDATVIVDLERHHIVAVLPDRQPETVAQWLIAHPGITVVSRDRAKGDGTAIRDGAPDTRQMADRWHLLKNLRDAL